MALRLQVIVMLAKRQLDERVVKVRLAGLLLLEPDLM
jgi:hypothetical protein